MRSKPTKAEIAAAMVELSWLTDVAPYVALAQPYMAQPAEFEAALAKEIRALGDDRVEETAHALMVLALAA